jgi:anti-sigma B factor antagonist
MFQEFVVIEGEVLVHLKGKIYVDQATMIREKLFTFIESGHYRFVVDLANVTYIDSSGLGVLVAIHKNVLQNNGRVKLTGLHGDVLELFELTRLTKVFETD